MPERKQKVLITGGSGLIGGLTIKHLGDKYDFSNVSRRPVEGIPTTQASIADYDAIRPAFDGVDMVLHLAAYVDDIDDWEGTMSITVGGTLNVFKAAQDAGIGRVVNMSTGSTMCGWEWYEGSPYGKLAAGRRSGPRSGRRERRWWSTVPGPPAHSPRGWAKNSSPSSTRRWPASQRRPPSARSAKPYVVSPPGREAQSSPSSPSSSAASGSSAPLFGPRP